MSSTVTHDPAPDSGFVIRVDLTDDGMPGRSEQLWVKQVGPTRFVLRSLPFFAYGLRPGDELETDDTYTFQRVVAVSGLHLLRVAAELHAAEQVHGRLHPLLEELALDHEWHRNGYVAIELASPSVPAELQAVLAEEQDAGRLRYELV